MHNGWKLAQSRAPLNMRVGCNTLSQLPSVSARIRSAHICHLAGPSDAQRGVLRARAQRPRRSHARTELSVVVDWDEFKHKAAPRIFARALLSAETRIQTSNSGASQGAKHAPFECVWFRMHSAQRTAGASMYLVAEDEEPQWSKI